MFKAIKTDQPIVDKNFDVIMRDLERLENMIGGLKIQIEKMARSLNVLGNKI